MILAGPSRCRSPRCLRDHAEFAGLWACSAIGPRRQPEEQTTSVKGFDSERGNLKHEAAPFPFFFPVFCRSRPILLLAVGAQRVEAEHPFVARRGSFEMCSVFRGTRGEEPPLHRCFGSFNPRRKQLTCET